MVKDKPASSLMKCTEACQNKPQDNQAPSPATKNTYSQKKISLRMEIVILAHFLGKLVIVTTANRKKKN